MFVCPVCVGAVNFTSGQAFLAHFNFYHSKCIAAGCMSCPYNNCFREFGKYNSFRKHVVSHKTIGNVPPIHTEAEECHADVNVYEASQSELTNSSGNFQNEGDKVVVTAEEGLTFDEALTKSVVTYIASLYDCGLTESQIQLMIESHMQLLGGGFLSILKDNVLSLISKANRSKLVSDTEIRVVTQMFNSCENMFQGFDTHYLRLKEFEASGAYIKSEAFIIGPGLDNQSVDGNVVVQPIDLVGQHIPLRHVLKGFLELSNVLHDIKSHIIDLETSLSQPNRKMENLIQGKLWQEKIKPMFQGKLVLPLTFNFDDYETNKELGTHTGVHKLGAGYIRISCLPPKFQSTLENIFLAVLFHSGDRDCGNGKVFRKLIAELKFLEECGISVIADGNVHQVYFALALVIGDNLGSNGILGFVESFSANYFCRVCSEYNETTKTQTVLNPAKLRTQETYLNDLQINNESLTGRKGICVFDELKAFKVSENLHVDLMHDFDEGVWKYLMYNIVKYFYDKGRYSVDYLNELIQGFYYGCNEEKNRIPLITKDDLVKYKRLKLSASEFRCLVRYFSLMVGHLVRDEDKNVWQLYLQARKILDIVTAPIVSCVDAQRLELLLREHHVEYMRLFETHLKPKFHIALHYPAIIESIGPPDPLSCYRLESKHKEGKVTAHNSNNRINLPFTVAKRHQLKLACRYLSGRGLIPKFDYSSVQVVRVGNIKDILKFSHVIPPQHLDQSWSTVKWLQKNGVKYTLGTVVVPMMNENIPVFGRIHTISICTGNKAFLVLKLFDTIQFDNHYYAYDVKEGTDWLFLSVEDLVTFVATEVHTGVHGKNLIPFRFSLSCFNS